MTVTYEWKIEQLDVVPSTEDLSNVVYRIHWRLCATSGDLAADFHGAVTLSPPAEAAFIDYSGLAYETVIEWLEAAIDAKANDSEASVAQMRHDLAAMLGVTAAPVPMALPWA
jgi:hypothetical protein